MQKVLESSWVRFTKVNICSVLYVSVYRSRAKQFTRDLHLRKEVLATGPMIKSMLEKGSITRKGLTQYNEEQTNTDQGNRNIWNVNSFWPVPLLCTVINSISMNASKLNVW